MASAFIIAGTVITQTAANPLVNLPTPGGGILANDIVFIQLTSKDNAVHSVGSGDWTNIFNRSQGTSFQHSLWWKRMSGGETGTVSTTISGTTLKMTKAALYRGVRTTGDPHEAATENGLSSNATITPTDIAVTDGDLIAIFVGVNDDNLVGPYTGGNTGTFTEQYEENTTLSTDGTIGLHDAAPGGTGTRDPGTFVMAAADAWAAFALSLVPEPAGGGGGLVTRKTLMGVGI